MLTPHSWLPRFVANPFSILILLTFITACGQGRSSESATEAHFHGTFTSPKTTVDESFTTGALCTTSDPNFAELRYPEKIPYCNRNISESEKKLVAQHYGIPASEFFQYEFDHFIPLAIGGSNDASNLWPQRLDEAQAKDGLEVSLYAAMKAGNVTQDSAVQQIRSWRPQLVP